MGESGPKSGVKGVVEDVKGKAKEAVGAITNNDRLQEEGEAQQDKAEAEREVAKREGQADVARAEAKEKEAEQKAAQKR
ncbi:MAG: hypothetical protein QOI95_550 [Acidimicrobiaceae bacterium]|jgi:uncharacterized protein YjbJ (UPF0337 family)